VPYWFINQTKLPISVCEDSTIILEEQKPVAYINDSIVLFTFSSSLNIDISNKNISEKINKDILSNKIIISINKSTYSRSFGIENT
jgi:hypothetical protein